jgi:hypothetical protein
MILANEKWPKAHAKKFLHGGPANDHHTCSRPAENTPMEYFDKARSEFLIMTSKVDKTLIR